MRATGFGWGEPLARETPSPCVANYRLETRDALQPTAIRASSSRSRVGVGSARVVCHRLTHVPGSASRRCAHRYDCASRNALRCCTSEFLRFPWDIFVKYPARPSMLPTGRRPRPWLRSPLPRAAAGRRGPRLRRGRSPPAPGGASRTTRKTPCLRGALLSKAGKRPVTHATAG